MKIFKKIYLIVLILITIIALGVLTYPSISNYINNKYAVNTISKYQNQMNNTSQDEINELIEKSIIYNKCISEGVKPKDKFEEGYMFGYIEIPKIGVNLPIYEGASKEILKKGAGIIEETSIPIGGSNTHSVLAAHTGAVSQKFFTDIDQLKKGDLFFIHIFNRDLAYEVDDINIVKPNDTSKIHVYPNKDYVTLLTCYPYGISTDRLLVRGKRIDYDFNKKTEEPKNINNVNNLKIGLKMKLEICLLILVIVFLFIIIILNKKRNY